MTQEAKDKTSSYGAGGSIWRFTVKPFGLWNAPATFRRLMEGIHGQVQWQICICYQDYILIFSRTVNQYLVHWQSVFQRLREAHFKPKPKKCHFIRTSLFFGHVVSKEGQALIQRRFRKLSIVLHQKMSMNWGVPWALSAITGGSSLISLKLT